MGANGNMHNENFCPFDIWAPDHRCSINNKAFSAYIMHSQEIKDAISTLVVATNPDECKIQNIFTDEEIRYIEREVSWRRCLR